MEVICIVDDETKELSGIDIEDPRFGQCLVVRDKVFNKEMRLGMDCTRRTM